jgi:hypothetical protein
VRHCARAQGQRAKTDRIDAAVLTAYGVSLQPKPTAARTKLEQQLAGTKTIHWMPKDQRPFTLARFKVKQNGQPTEAWVPEWIDATDATGNEADFPIIDSGFTNGLAFYDAQGTSLSPSEVWRLRMRFRQEKDLVPNQLWTSPGLAVRGGVLLPTNLTTNFQTYNVTLQCSGRNTIRVKLDPRPQGCRLRLVEIVDDQGAKVEHTSGSFGNSQFEAEWVIPPKAESIKVTISLPEIRVFEFLGQPMRQ